MNIIIGVCGSISCYKAMDLTRELTKLNYKVKIILTKGAEQFVKTELFRYLGACEVYQSNDDFNLESYKQLDGTVLHVELAKWADKLVLYPASANTIARLANGQADDLLTSVFLMMENKGKIIFPAMNHQMLTNKLTQANLNKLSQIERTWIAPTLKGLLACGEIGAGKLIKPEQAIDLITTINFNHSGASKKILITTGASIAPLDEVRYLTNPSSGITGYYLAKSFLAKGHKVHLIAGLYSTNKLEVLTDHLNFTLTRVVSTKDYDQMVKELISDTDLYISSAALGDFEFDTQTGKIKKSGKQELILQAKASPDVLSNVLSSKAQNKKLKVIGFAAECDKNEATYLEKYHRKPVDLLVGNLVHNGSQNEIKGFLKDDGDYTFWQQGKLVHQAKLTKEKLGQYLVEWFDKTESYEPN
jgi:phosphopantothenoylcysteine decarboxylase / phosphopantothenate---cysteine ligase